MTIWKFDLKPTLRDEWAAIEMPKGAYIIHVDTQGQSPCMWAQVDPDEPKETRLFRSFGTGHDIEFDPDGMPFHWGSFILLGDQLVFHLYEKDFVLSTTVP